MRQSPASRGFDPMEFENRTAITQERMRDARMDAILVMTEPEVRYYSGFFSQFWESPTRPWYLVIPLQGKPIAVIPGIGAEGMAATWIDDIHTWSSPDLLDDGISLLATILKNLPKRFGRLGMPMGHESMLRMPVTDFFKLKDQLSVEIVDARDLIRRIRFIKSEAEIEKIRTACAIASTVFEQLPGKLSIGDSERDIARRFKLDLITEGADSAPYVMVGSGAGSYNDIIMGPTDRILEAGDVLIIDTGATYDGYFCDFDRNYAFGWVSDEAKRAYEVVFEATEAGFKTAKPGATSSDIWQAMWNVLEQGGAMGNEVGRLGHGLGMQLTEWPSNMPGDNTVLQPGAVLTLEPGMVFAPNQWMIHEENLVIREDGAEWLSRRAWKDIPIIE